MTKGVSKIASHLSRNWESMIRPTQVIRAVDGFDPAYLAEIVVEPLERGFGFTIGNALRRVLLSSLYGGAITSVKIPGILHEYSTKPGLKEDVLDVILNLKSIAIQMNVAESRLLKLDVVGPCVVTAGMIGVDSDVKVLNPDQRICTLSSDVQLQMELTCEFGKGYSPVTAATRNSDLPVGVIPIDAIFSPVTRVSYRVEDTRVGHVTNYDKLIMLVETDGSITPELAIALSAKILQDQMQLFVIFTEQEKKVAVVKDELEFDPVLLKRIDEFEFTVRTTNCLKGANIIYIGDLVAKSESEMLQIPNFGRKSLSELRLVLSEFKLAFGMTIPAWPPKNIKELAKKYQG